MRMLRLLVVVIGTGAAGLACGGGNEGNGGGDPTSAGGSGGSGTGGGTSSTTGSGGGTGGSGGSGGATTSTGGGGSGGATTSTGGGGSGGATTSTGGGGSGGSGGAAPGAPECTADADCVLVNDCCRCEAIAIGAPPPACDIPECFIPVCQSLGAGNAPPVCVAGQCAVGFQCNPKGVVCDQIPPVCPQGQVPSVQGACWGPCVSALECLEVGSCGECENAGLGCASMITKLGASAHCVPVPAACGGKPTCACMGAAVCIAPFDACGDGPKGELVCSCPACK